MTHISEACDHNHLLLMVENHKYRSIVASAWYAYQVSGKSVQFSDVVSGEDTWTQGNLTA
jgi:hypothetical protein